MTEFDTPIEPIETEQEQEVQEQPTPEQIAKDWLKEQGVNPDEFDPKKVANLTNWERELNRKSSDLGAIAKRIETPKEEAATADFDPKDLDTLSDALKAIGLSPDEVKQAIAMQRQSVDEARAEVAESFFAAHKDVSPDAIIRELYEDGVDLDTISPARLKRELDKAYKVKKAESLDEGTIEAKAKELAQKMLDEMTKDGNVVGVRKSRGSAAGAHKTYGDVMDDASLSMFDKFDIAAKLPE